MKGKIVIELLGEDKLSVDVQACISKNDKVQILMSLAQSLSERDANKTAELLERTSLLAIINRMHPVNSIRVADEETGVQIDSDFLKFLEELTDGKERS